MADINMSVSIEEQEICINAMRDEKFATIYASDSTYITKLDKLCKESPDMYSLIEDTGRGKKYLLKDKTLISFRAKKTTRVMTDEQKKASAERLRKARENKSVWDTLSSQKFTIMTVHRKFYPYSWRNTRLRIIFFKLQ